MGIPAPSSTYSQAIRDVVDAGDLLLEWLHETRERKTVALSKLVQAVDGLGTQTSARREPSETLEQPFLMAAAEMRAGYLLIAAGRAVDSGERLGLESSLAQLRAELQEVEAGSIRSLFFESDLLEPPVEAGD